MWLGLSDAARSWQKAEAAWIADQYIDRGETGGRLRPTGGRRFAARTPLAMEDAGDDFDEIAQGRQPSISRPPVMKPSRSQLAQALTSYRTPAARTHRSPRTSQGSPTTLRAWRPSKRSEAALSLDRSGSSCDRTGGAYTDHRRTLPLSGIPDAYFDPGITTQKM